MNNALNILGFADTKMSEIKWKDIKQKYRIYALMYHPDKNKSEDAPLKFLEIQEAYEYLENKWSKEEIDIETEIESAEPNGNGYTDILHSVLNVLAKNQKINDILENILSICENKSIQIIENLDKRKFNLVYVILNKYRNVFCLSDHFYQEMENMRKKSSKHPDTLEIITLRPTINEIWEMITYSEKINVNIDKVWDHLVYKYTRGEQIYYVPLWHKELIYEDNKKEFMVECILDDNKIWIDDENNIHQEQIYSIIDIFKKDMIEVFYGKRSFTFSPEIIQLKSKQTIVWYQEGISKIMPDIHNISRKSDVYLHISLHI